MPLAKQMPGHVLDGNPEFVVSLIDAEGWARIESVLIQEGVPMPLTHRAAWIDAIEHGAPYRFIVVRAHDSDSVAAAFPVAQRAVRALPGHFALEVTRFGYGGDLKALGLVLEALRSMVDEEPHALGAKVQVFATEAHRRNQLQALARSTGFQENEEAGRYQQTPCIRLDPNEAELLGSFSSTCRRFIRNPEKKGYSVGLLEDERWTNQLEVLWNETFARTGVEPPERSWRQHLAFARRNPELYHIVGLFGPGFPDPASLKAFSCARHHGDHAEYSDGASTRHVEAGVALSYAPMWALIRWAKTHGCQWFDLGGITTEASDPRAGISDFKRRFTEDIIEVGGEWRYSPPSVRALIRDRISGTARVVRNLLH